MPSNTKEYHREYMKRYVTDSEDVYCKECNCTYKKYRKYRHVKTQKHIDNVEKAENKNAEKPMLERILSKIEKLEDMLAVKKAKTKATAD